MTSVPESNIFVLCLWVGFTIESREIVGAMMSGKAAERTAKEVLLGSNIPIILKQSETDGINLLLV